MFNAFDPHLYHIEFIHYIYIFFSPVLISFHCHIETFEISPVSVKLTNNKWFRRNICFRQVHQSQQQTIRNWYGARLFERIMRFAWMWLKLWLRLCFYSLNVSLFSPFSFSFSHKHTHRVECSCQKKKSLSGETLEILQFIYVEFAIYWHQFNRHQCQFGFSKVALLSDTMIFTVHVTWLLHLYRRYNRNATKCV